jgi:type IV secretion system protein TrbG
MTPRNQRSLQIKIGNGFPALLICAYALAGCTTFKPPQISYDDEIPPLPDQRPLADDRPRALHVPPAWTPARGGKEKEAEAPIERIEGANDAARVQPRKAGYFNPALSEPRPTASASPGSNAATRMVSLRRPSGGAPFSQS